MAKITGVIRGITHLAAELALELLVLVPCVDLPAVRLQVVKELAHVAAVLGRNSIQK